MDLESRGIQKRHAVRHWGQLGGTDIHSAPTKRLPMWNTTWRWLVTAALLNAETALLSTLVGSETLSWNQPEFALALIVAFIFNAYVGWLVMALSALIVVFGLKATNQGWFKIGIALKLTALLLGPGLSALLSASQYMPIAVMIWCLAVIQFLFVLGIVTGRPLTSWAWFPVRGLVVLS
ncbi:hypothetical protein [Pseudarthrobacter sp. Y6]|uniref:hypothetical protein n=1 Tax=Pseudarthrobacter sp. Y6 TaxID=3418422 RepID=UPI003CEDAEC3